MKTPEQMSGLMAKFFGSLLPFFALLWAIDLLLFYRTLYRELFGITELTKLIPPLGAIGVAILLILLPIRTCINKCYEDEQA